MFLTDYPGYADYVRVRILAKSIPNVNGCIEYQPGKLKHRYGLTSITIKGVRIVVPVHRAVWMSTNNQLDLPTNVLIRHKCDNPRCVNIDHLEQGTAKDNTQDMLERGRRSKTHKLHTRKRIWDNAIILAIKAETGRNHDIALKYGVSDSYVSKLRSGKAKTLI